MEPRTTRAAPLNAATQRFKPSGIRRIADLATKRLAAGQPLYPFHLGEPDVDTPAAIKAAAVAALEAGHVHYAPNAGIPALREAIAKDLRRRYPQAPVVGDQVIVSVGACEALTLAFMATLEPGTELVVPTPCWPNYLQTPILLGARVKQVAMRANYGFALDADAILSAVTDATRAIVINTPNNPSGNVASAATLRRLLDGARERGIWVIVDEIYRDLVYAAPAQGVWTEALPDDPLIYVNGFSKSYAMTGWRIGYAVGRPDAVTAMTRIHQALVTSVTTFVQHAALCALELHDEVAAMQRRYQGRLERIAPRLRAAGYDFPMPAGGFYLFPRVPAGYRDGDHFADVMLAEYGVALVPGSVFGEMHTDRFRLCFSCADDLLDRGTDLLIQALPIVAKG